MEEIEPMTRYLRLAGLAAALALLGRPAAAEEPSLVERILRDDGRFSALLADPARYRLQIVLGLVDDASGKPRLVQHAYRAGAEYFYPASAIKLCAAVAALEELTALAAATALAIDETTPLVYPPLFPDEELEERDPSNLDGGRITAAHEIRKLFLVSDNVAFNRLYELVGPARLNRSMHRAGLASARIVHRLAERRTPEENLRLPRIEFAGDGFRHVIPERTDELELADDSIAGIEVGTGQMVDGALVPGPMDFSEKNRMSLADLQRALAMVVRPDVDAGGAGFRLSEHQRALLRDAMHPYPRQSRNPVYDPEEYPDEWVKFLLPGLCRVIPGDGLRIYNKSGMAYGFLTENAYVVDLETGRSFFLAATIYANENGVLNDDDYGYETVSEPFLADLAEAVARSAATSQTTAITPAVEKESARPTTKERGR